MEHVVKRGEYLSKIAAAYGISLNRLLSANPRFKADPDSVAVGDRLQIPDQAADPAAAAAAVNASGDEDLFTVPQGQLTFNAEGQERRNRYFSRVPHVPGASSGLTIGRGYDMGSRSEDEIVQDLTNAGIDDGLARRLAAGRGLKGARARAFIQQNDLAEVEITPAQQKALFIQTYQELAGDVLRICRKADVVAKYGETDWGNLNPLIRDIVVDLRYRGDYQGVTRERVQPVVVNNDLAALRTLMADEVYWRGRWGVPRVRFELRRDYVSA